MPRFQGLRSLSTPQILGVDIDGLAPGEPAVIDAEALGFPYESLAEIPAGDYYVLCGLAANVPGGRWDGCQGI